MRHARKGIQDALETSSELAKEYIQNGVDRAKREVKFRWPRRA